MTFLVIAALSIALSFLLTGRQIYQANWSLVDDHVVFYFLGPDLDLPFGEIWNTLLTKTEVGIQTGRFRPTYYLFMLIETWLWGANVHLWYLARTLCFALFLSSIWWVIRRFVGVWLGGALTIWIAILPLWAEVWSRLGPSEIYGAGCIGVMVFATDFILHSDSARTRNLNAIVLALATIALVGLKETFIPLVLGPAVIFVWAGIGKRLSPLLIGLLSLIMLACIGGIVLVVSRQVLAAGTDYYANTIGPWQTLSFGAIGFFTAVVRTWWLIVVPFALLWISGMIPRKSMTAWIADSRGALGAYGFLLVSYAAQCALYRSGFPKYNRYDFPAMLLVPLTCCILACYLSREIRPLLRKRTIDRAQFAVAIVLLFAVLAVPIKRTLPLVEAVRTNIGTTDLFYGELQRVVDAAKASPDTPVILEAHTPHVYEPVFSLSYYMPALGVRNRMAVRLHPNEKSEGKLHENLWQALSRLEQRGDSTFTALPDILAGNPRHCISIGLNGPPEPGCAGFRMDVR